MAVIGFYTALAFIAVDALPGVEVDSANVVALLGLVPTLLGIVNWRNVGEARADPQSYFDEGA